jgi:hypothetical protein
MDVLALKGLYDLQQCGEASWGSMLGPSGAQTICVLTSSGSWFSISSSFTACRYSVLAEASCTDVIP